MKVISTNSTRSEGYIGNENYKFEWAKKKEKECTFFYNISFIIFKFKGNQERKNHELSTG